MGLAGSESIGRIAVDPTNSNIVFAAASGHVARSAAQRGLYRTTDAGKTWELVLAPPNSSTGAVDIAINPQNPQIVYADAVGPPAHQRHPHLRRRRLRPVPLQRRRHDVEAPGDDGRRPGDPGRDPDGYDETGTGLKQDASLGRIGVAVAPSNPNRVYVIFGELHGNDKGFYYSNNGGDTWCTTGGTAECPTPAGRAGANSRFEWWFGRLFVDPDDQNHLFKMDVALRASINGGQTWTSINFPHADQHGMSWDPVHARRQPGDPEPRLPRQRRRHVSLRRERRRQRQHGDHRVRQGRQPAVEPDLPPRGLPAAPEPPHPGPAGQRLQQELDRRGRSRSRPIRSCATGSARAAATVTTTRSTRPTTTSTTRARSPRAAARTAARAAPTTGRRRRPRTSRRSGASRHQPLHDGRPDRDRPEHPAEERRRHAAAERALRGRRDDRALAQPRREHDADLAAAAAAEQLHRPRSVAAGPRARRRGGHRALRQPLRRGDVRSRRPSRRRRSRTRR